MVPGGKDSNSRWGHGAVFLIAPDTKEKWREGERRGLLNKVLAAGVRITRRYDECTHVVAQYLHVEGEMVDEHHELIIKAQADESKVLANMIWVQCCVFERCLIDPTQCGGLQPFFWAGHIDGFAEMRVAIGGVEDEMTYFLISEMVCEAGANVVKYEGPATSDILVVDALNVEFLSAIDWARTREIVVGLEWVDDCITEWKKFPTHSYRIHRSAPDPSNCQEPILLSPGPAPALSSAPRALNKENHNLPQRPDGTAKTSPVQRSRGECSGKGTPKSRGAGAFADIGAQGDRNTARVSVGNNVFNYESEAGGEISDGDVDDDDDDMPLVTLQGQRRPTDADLVALREQRRPTDVDELDDEPIFGSRYVEAAMAAVESSGKNAAKAKKKAKKPPSDSSKKPLSDSAKKPPSDSAKKPPSDSAKKPPSDSAKKPSSANKSPSSSQDDATWGVRSEDDDDYSEFVSVVKDDAWRRARSRMSVSGDEHDEEGEKEEAVGTTRVTVPAKRTKHWETLLDNVRSSKTSWLLKVEGKEGSVHLPRLMELCEAMSINTSTRKLDLDNASFGDDGCACIAKMLRNNTTLKKLDLQMCGISDHGCEVLCKGLESSNAKIRELNLMMNSITATSVDALAQALALQPSCCLILTNEMIEKVKERRTEFLREARGLDSATYRKMSRQPALTQAQAHTSSSSKREPTIRAVQVDVGVEERNLSGSDHDEYGSDMDRYGSDDDRYGSDGDRYESADDRYGSDNDRYGSDKNRNGSEEEAGCKTCLTKSTDPSVLSAVTDPSVLSAVTEEDQNSKQPIVLAPPESSTTMTSDTLAATHHQHNHDHDDANHDNEDGDVLRERWRESFFVTTVSESASPPQTERRDAACSSPPPQQEAPSVEASHHTSTNLATVSDSTSTRPCPSPALSRLPPQPAHSSTLPSSSSSPGPAHSRARAPSSPPHASPRRSPTEGGPPYADRGTPPTHVLRKRPHPCVDTTMLESNAEACRSASSSPPHKRLSPPSASSFTEDALMRLM